MTGGATSPQGAVSSLPGIGPILEAEFWSPHEISLPSRVPTGWLPTQILSLRPTTPASGRGITTGCAGKQASQAGLLPGRLRSAPESRAFYACKRSEGKKHTQVLMALAWRWVNVFRTCVGLFSVEFASSSAPCCQLMPSVSLPFSLGPWQSQALPVYVHG